jgi:peptidoglycan hydrolase CwlO-like protein
VLAVLAVAATALLVTWSPARGDLQQRIRAQESQEDRLEAAIARETQRIEAANDGLAQAQARLAELSARLDARRAELEEVQHELVDARDRLTRLENRYRRAAGALAENLRAGYMNGSPDLVTVMLDSQGFSDLVERVEFLKRVGRQQARVLAATKDTKAEVMEQARRLDRLQLRNRRLVAAAASARDEASAVQTAILRHRERLLAGRADRQAELNEVRGELSELRREQRAQARAAARAAQEAGIAPDPNGSIGLDSGGVAQPPAGAPEAVRLVMAAGNAIAGLPYSYGGGHASFQASAYDCSGSISYALAAAGLVSSPMASTGFMSWGEPGPGKWITVYANAGHAYMVVAGWRFDTSALSSGGTRWTRAQRSSAGFVARHPPGL